MFTFSRTTLVFDIPDEPSKGKSSAPSSIAGTGFLDTCAAALKQIDEAEEILRPIQNLLRARRDEYNKRQLKLYKTQNYRPFDLLPDELVVEVFRRALVGSHEKPHDDTAMDDSLSDEDRLTRTSLSHVCRGWNTILESVVCVSMPDVHLITVTEKSLLSGALVNHIHSIARFPGPIFITLSCGVPFNSPAWTPPRNIISHLRSLSAALGSPHRATISLDLRHFTLDVLGFIMKDAGCQTFARIASLSIFFSSPSLPHVIRILGKPAVRPPTPQFPLLCHVGLNLLHCPSAQSDEWDWLFHDSVCKNLLSFTGSCIPVDDLAWMLGRTPRLRDLRLKTAFVHFLDGVQATISHPNLRQLTLSWEYSATIIKCPKLETLISPDCHTVGDWEISAESLTNLTALTIGCKENTVVPSLKMAGFASMTRLCFIDINKPGMTNLAEACAGGGMPHLSALYLRYTPWTHSEFSDTDTGTEAETDSEIYISSSGFVTRTSSFEEVIASLRTISQAPSINIIDFRAQLPSITVRAKLLSMLRRLRPVVETKSDVGDADSDSEWNTDSDDDSFDADVDFEFIEDLLQEEEEFTLEEISKAWTTFVTQNQKQVTDGLNPPAYGLWTSFPTFWSLVEKLRRHFVGTSFPLHEDIINGWKKGSCSPREKEWMIGFSPALEDDPGSLSGYRFEGLFYGQQHGSMMYDLRQEDHHYYFADCDRPDFDHGITESVGGISKPVLRQLGFPSYL